MPSKLPRSFFDKGWQWSGKLLSGQKAKLMSSWLRHFRSRSFAKMLSLRQKTGTFYENGGINYSRFILVILTAGRSGGGLPSPSAGQNAHSSQDRPSSGSVKEFSLALEINKKYSKVRPCTSIIPILKWGLGCEDASKKYWSFKASSSLDQSAVLAMLKGPDIIHRTSWCQRAGWLVLKIWLLQALLIRGRPIRLPL